MDSVRIDKYLWAIRVYKTRTDATDACKGNKVSVGGQAVKPSREVKVGDMVEVRKGAVTFSYRVTALLEKRVGAKEVERFADNVTPQSELDKLHAPVESFFIKRDRGAGRPTKKERREMDSLYGSFFIDDSDSDDED
ncbi:MAG: RNA-binding S4 domain-containing protein [Bacteroidales bacterium]|nr:RNA-binding S4 domain-containing protein [Candidatus Cacconaster merdequi]